VSSERSAERWARLRSGGHESTVLEIPSVDTGISTGFGTIRLALGENGEARLLLPVRQSERLDIDEGSQSILIGSRSYHLKGVSTRYLDITCTAGPLETVFTEVADEIMLRVEQGHSAQQACLTTIRDFRDLLATPPALVEERQIRGLVGELIMLNRLLAISPLAWRLWTGPLMERHDFRGGTDAIEVKTTSRVSSWSVEISSVDQLLEPDDGQLRLVLYQLEHAVAGRLSVSQLTAEARRQASHPRQIEALLASMGCGDPDSDIWNEASFELAGEHFFRVGAAFPRIIPATFGGAVPPGIESIGYRLDLSGAREFQIDAMHVEEELRGMVTWLER